MVALSPKQVEALLGSVPGWQVHWDAETGELVREFTFADFLAALHFVDQVGALAENAGHHPDIDIRYNRVRLTLTTHDAGGLTEKDFSLAQQVDDLL